MRKRKIALLIYLLYKEKIYNEFHALVYKEFNKSIADINYYFRYDDNHLFEFLRKHLMKVDQ